MSACGGLIRAALAGAVVGLLLAVLYVCLGPTRSQHGWLGRFASNGERICFTATSERRTPI